MTLLSVEGKGSMGIKPGLPAFLCLWQRNVSGLTLLAEHIALLVSQPEKSMSSKFWHLASFV